MPKINYEALRDAIEQDYLSDMPGNDGASAEFLRVNKRFAKAHAEAAIACMKITDPDTAPEEPVTIQTLLEVLVMLAASPILNTINNVVPEIAREAAREEAMKQFLIALQPDAEFVETRVTPADFREH